MTEPWTYAMNTGLVSDTWFPYVSGNGRVPAWITKCVNN